MHTDIGLRSPVTRMLGNYQSVQTHRGPLKRSFHSRFKLAHSCQKKNTICEWILDWEAQDENFFEKICLMDEATFSRNGVSNLRCHQNPHLIRVCIINISAAGLQGEWPLVDRIM
jgi:hypothetical protein